MILLLISCGNPHIQQATDLTAPPPTVSHSIPVFFEDVPYDKGIRDKIAMELDRWPKLHGRLKKVIVARDIGNDLAGLHRSDVIYLKKERWHVMKRILWHEIGHNLQQDLTKEQIYKWSEIAAIRLTDAGLEDWLGDHWDSTAGVRGFPSNYATKSMWEYMSEHLDHFTFRPEGHKMLYSAEHALILECGWAPRDPNSSSRKP